MNHSTLLQSSFSLDGPVTTESDYTAAHRQFSGPAGFPMDDDENSRRGGVISHPLAQPVSIPALTNGLRYGAQQPAMHDVPFATSPTILMSPTDSCSDTFSPTSGSIYSHSPSLQYDRMPDFRPHRASPLQPPTMQTQGTGIPSSSILMGRNDYPATYTLHRGSTFPSLSSLSDMSRLSPYTSTPRALENTMDRSQSLLFGQNGNMMMDPQHRLSQPIVDAPPFNETNNLLSVIAGSQTIKPEIQAKIHKGFFQVDDKWTCYRRNYFSVSCSFSLHPWTNAPLFLKCPDQATERILAFSMSISAIVNAQYGEVRELVQHTPKRDKQSERKPGKVVLQPCQPPPLVLGHGSTSSNSHHAFALTSHSAGIPMDYSSSYTSTPQQSQPPTQHTFERIQFQKATANNGKRRAQQQYYNLVVELYAQIANPAGGSNTQWIKIARRLSHPMVVRGRSPGHYKDGRRDSSTSMGPDGGSGSSGDGSGGAVLPPGIGQAARSHLTLMSYDPSQRGGPHYGRADYHQMADQSSLSSSPHISSSSSSAFDIGVLNDSMDPMDTIKSTASMDSYPDAGFTLIDRKSDSQFRNHLPPFEYDSLSKTSDDSGNSFPEPFDSMISMMPNEPSDSSHFLKHAPRLTPQLHHVSSTSGFDPVYSTRSSDSGSYYRYPNSQRLCT